MRRNDWDSRGHRSRTATTAPSNDTKKGVVAHRKHQPPSKTRRWAAAESEAEVMDDIIKPASTPRPRRQHTLLEALREDAPIARISLTTETARHDDETNRPTRQGRVRDAAEIATVGPLRNRAASRPLGGRVGRFLRVPGGFLRVVDGVLRVWCGRAGSKTGPCPQIPICPRKSLH
jgi:hypothetical protein